MHADAFLTAAENLPVAGLDALTDGGGLVVVAPHPDDESLGCGGLIAEACARGREVRLVIVSDGCGSHTHSALYPPLRLRALREEETLEAVAALGLAPANVTFLRLPDAGVPSSGPEAQAAADVVASVAQQSGAGAVCVTWAHDPHCDHQAAAAIVRLAQPKLGATKAFAYPVWGWTLPQGTEVGAPPSGYRVDVSAHVAAKARAVAAHRSQTTDLISDDQTGFRLAPEMIARFLGPTRSSSPCRRTPRERHHHHPEQGPRRASGAPARRARPGHASGRMHRGGDGGEPRPPPRSRLSHPPHRPSERRPAAGPCPPTPDAARPRAIT